MGLVLLRLAQTAAYIFSEAIQFDCLIRGGITIGPLYHSEGVVFGRGLVDAHQIESKLALYPRVVVAQKVISWLGGDPATMPDLIKRHDDGFFSLNYLRQTFDEISRGKSGENEPMESRQRWVAEMRDTCRREIIHLAQANNGRGHQNWSWFLSQFESFVSREDISRGIWGPVGLTC